MAAGFATETSRACQRRRLVSVVAFARQAWAAHRIRRLALAVLTAAGGAAALATVFGFSVTSVATALNAVAVLVESVHRVLVQSAASSARVQGNRSRPAAMSLGRRSRQKYGCLRRSRHRRTR